MGASRTKPASATNPQRARRRAESLQRGKSIFEVMGAKAWAASLRWIVGSLIVGSLIVGSSTNDQRKRSTISRRAGACPPPPCSKPAFDSGDDEVTAEPDGGHAGDFGERGCGFRQMCCAGDYA